MGNNGKNSEYRPLKGSTIRSILASNQNGKDNSGKDETMPVPSDKLITLYRHESYDTLDPEGNIKDFTSFIRSVITRYEENERLVIEYEKETQDILHYIELHADLNAQQGCVMYKKLREVRRKRRKCKNEMDLLNPVYQFFKTEHADLQQKLSAVQGKCRTLKSGIDTRQYTLRTGVMDS